MHFIVFWLVGFLENGPKEKNLGNCWGSFATANGPLAAAKSFAAVKQAEKRNFPPSGSQWRSHCSQHGNAVFLFHFVFSLF